MSKLTQYAKDLRRNMTDAEQRLWKYLRAHRLNGTKFKRQQPIANYIVDFVCFEANLIIELDGGQHAEQIEYDKKRDAFFEKQGFAVLRFWNNDVLQNTEGVLTDVLRALEHPLPTLSQRSGRGEKKQNTKSRSMPPCLPTLSQRSGRGENKQNTKSRSMPAFLKIHNSPITKMHIIRRPSSPTPLESHTLHPVLKRIYMARGVVSPQELETDLAHLLPFSLLKGIDSCVAHIYGALQAQQHILILGDFDADGATSSALAVKALSSFGAKQVSYLVPNRFEYGYGLTPEIVDVAARQKPDVIITVDNGISSVEGVAHANALGIKVLITDHHLPGDHLPEAAAIVNPNQVGDTFPSKNLAGVGVIFYVMLALRSYLREVNWFTQQNIPEPNMAALLDLVALGTVADVVPLDRNNRILVKQGLQRMRAEKNCPGIQALLFVANRENSRLVANDLGFAVAPRLNAAGRLEDMSQGIACLLAADFETALPMAHHLDALNKERREIEGQMQEQAISALASLQLTQDLPMGLCLHDDSWHQGVIGILASRIKERVHRPVIAFASINPEELKGSARSVPGLHIRDVLDAVAKRHPHLIQKFGGHAMAAGLSLRLEHYTAFSAAFAEEVACRLSVEDLQQKRWSDGELIEQEMTLEIASLLRESGPWGQAFPEPLFDNIFFIQEQYIVGGKHLKMVLRLTEDSPPLEAIAFFVDVEKWPNHRADKVHAAYRLDVNVYQGRKKVQLLVEDLVVL
jgi:single-stranded-DNA-specific exonuclease